METHHVLLHERLKDVCLWGGNSRTLTPRARSTRLRPAGYDFLVDLGRDTLCTHLVFTESAARR